MITWTSGISLTVQSHEGSWLRLRSANLVKLGKHNGSKTTSYAEFRDSDAVVEATKQNHGTCRQIHPSSASDLLITHCGVELLVSVHRTPEVLLVNKFLEEELGVKTWEGLEWHKWEPRHDGPLVTTVITNSYKLLLVVVTEDHAAHTVRRCRRQLLDQAREHYDTRPKVKASVLPTARTVCHNRSDGPLRFELPTAGTHLDLSFHKDLQVIVCWGGMSYDEFCKHYACMPGNGLDGRIPTDRMLAQAEENFARLRDVVQKPVSWRQLLCHHARLDLHAVLTPREHDYEPLWFNEDDAVERAFEKFIFHDLPSVPCVRMAQWRQLTTDFGEKVWCATSLDSTVHIAFDVCY